MALRVSSPSVVVVVVVVVDVCRAVSMGSGFNLSDSKLTFLLSSSSSMYTCDTIADRNDTPERERYRGSSCMYVSMYVYCTCMYV